MYKKGVMMDNRWGCMMDECIAFKTLSKIQYTLIKYSKTVHKIDSNKCSSFVFLSVEQLGCIVSHKSLPTTFQYFSYKNT